ncbi:MAG TPA: HDOD domain-containing protein [Steroidobacteraceae bacterium]|nr:HDOD domain-containing protein [Steroidobacteraceae bacterium]
MNAVSAASGAVSVSTEHCDAEREPFVFVQALAAELSRGDVELPGFPEIVIRIRRVLADENVSAERVARVVAAEPVIAARLMRIAGSAALNPGGKPVADLRSAIHRVGLNTVRSATLAFAVNQLRQSGELRGLEKPLEVLWHRSVLIASLSFVLARRISGVSPETALLAGLLQSLGRLYILTRASRHRSLFADVGTYQAIERDWHLGIACALLEHWGIADEIVQAVRESEDYAREPRGAVSLSDVLVAACLIAVHQNQPELLDARLRSVRPIARLQLDRAACDALIVDSAHEIAALREALS